jgi:preprotein translocase subunit secB
MVNCEELNVIEEIFKKNEGRNFSEVNIPVTSNLDAYKNSDKSEERIRLDLTLKVGTENDIVLPFYYKIKISGLFDWVDEKNSGTMRELQDEGSQILYSFVRTYFFDALKKANLNPYVLPQMDII